MDKPKVLTFPQKEVPKKQTLVESLQSIIDMVEDELSTDPDRTPTEFAMLIESKTETFVLTNYDSQSDAHFAFSMAQQMVLAPWMYYGAMDEED